LFGDCLMSWVGLLDSFWCVPVSFWSGYDHLRHDLWPTTHGWSRGLSGFVCENCVPAGCRLVWLACHMPGYSTYWSALRFAVGLLVCQLLPCHKYRSGVVHVYTYTDIKVYMWLVWGCGWLWNTDTHVVIVCVDVHGFHVCLYGDFCHGCLSVCQLVPI